MPKRYLYFRFSFLKSRKGLKRSICRKALAENSQAGNICRTKTGIKSSNQTKRNQKHQENQTDLKPETKSFALNGKPVDLSKQPISISQNQQGQGKEGDLHAGQGKGARHHRR